MKSHEAAEVLVACGRGLKRKVKTDGVLHVGLGEGRIVGRVSADVPQPLYSGSTKSWVLWSTSELQPGVTVESSQEKILLDEVTRVVAIADVVLR